MVTKVYNFFYSGAGNASGLVNNLVTQRGFITAYSLDLGIIPGSTSNDISFELSFVNAVQVGTNGVLGPICSIACSASFTAAGTGMFQASKSLSGLMIPVNAGDTIYVNSLNANGLTARFYARLYVNQP
jgi:hypothetical protein